jgi:hypothetical protein
MMVLAELARRSRVENVSKILCERDAFRPG